MSDSPVDITGVAASASSLTLSFWVRVVSWVSSVLGQDSPAQFDVGSRWTRHLLQVCIALVSGLLYSRYGMPIVKPWVDDSSIDTRMVFMSVV